MVLKRGDNQVRILLEKTGPSINPHALGNVLLALVCGNVRLVVLCNLRIFLFNFNNLLPVQILPF